MVLDASKRKLLKREKKKKKEVRNSNEEMQRTRTRFCCLIIPKKMPSHFNSCSSVCIKCWTKMKVTNNPNSQSTPTQKAEVLEGDPNK